MATERDIVGQSLDEPITTPTRASGVIVVVPSLCPAAFRSIYDLTGIGADFAGFASRQWVAQSAGGCRISASVRASSAWTSGGSYRRWTVTP